MSRLTVSTEIKEHRFFGESIVHQRLDVVVDYNPEDMSIDLKAVNLYEDGKYKAEISKLLSAVRGNPVVAILEAQNWPRLYVDDQLHRRRFFSRLKGIYSLFNRLT